MLGRDLPTTGDEHCDRRSRGTTCPDEPSCLPGRCCSAANFLTIPVFPPAASLCTIDCYHWNHTRRAGSLLQQILAFSLVLTHYSEPVFVNLLRSPWIDFQPGGIDSLESIPGLLKRLQIRALMHAYTDPDTVFFGHLSRWNRFLGSLNVYKFGLWYMHTQTQILFFSVISLGRLAFSLFSISLYFSLIEIERKIKRKHPRILI